MDKTMRSRVSKGLWGGGLYLSVMLLCSHSLDAAADDAIQTSLLQMLSDGGWSMIPLLACSLAALFLVLYTVWETSARRMLPVGLVARYQEMSARSGAQAAATLLSDEPSLLARCLRFALAELATDSPAERYVQAVEREGKRLGQWVCYLNVVAAIAPMVGLLGTVSGMIGAFQTISSGGMGRPDMLAGNIGEALVTTATGLSIAIPTMVLFFIIRNRLENKIEDLMEVGLELLPSSDGCHDKIHE